MYLWPYLQTLWVHWWALMSCAVFTVIGVIVLAFNKSNRWALWATFGAAVAMLLWGSFLAWSDQYTENEVGRSVGSLAFSGVDFFGVVDSPREPKKANVQLTIKLKNIQPRLMECRVDEIKASIQGKKAPENHINRGGYVYGRQEIFFTIPFIKDTMCCRRSWERLNITSPTR